MGEVTRVLTEMRAGDASARGRLVDLVYGQLRALARGYMRSQPDSHTLEPTALVHEAFLRMIGHSDVQWNDRAHFFAACGEVMRHILADHARRQRAAKRGGGARSLALLNTVAAGLAESIDVVELDDALSALAALNDRHARVVECRFFAGMTVPEVAEALGVSARTVDSDWAMARAWLSARLSGGRT